METWLKKSRQRICGIAFLAIVCVGGCSGESDVVGVPAPTAAWAGIPSAVNQVIVAVHDSTGWILNKSQVEIKKSSDVRQSDNGQMADFIIRVKLGNESFETMAKNVPCDSDGIPTEASVDRLRNAVEEIKKKLTRIQQ
jgi:hypothetical protein